MKDRERNRPPVVIELILVFCLLIFQSCGGSRGSGGGNDFAGGGIGGTGKAVGTITAFGSIFVNGVEHILTGVPITVNGMSASEGDLDVGMKVVVNTNNGQTKSVEYDPDISGPVTSVDPAAGTLIAMGTTVAVDSTTVFTGVSGLSALNTGDIIEVSGFFDSSGELRATYIKLDNSIQLFSLEGTVSNRNPVTKTFTIGSLSVDYSGVISSPEFTNGSYVEVDGTIQGNTLVASTLEIDSQLPPVSDGEEMKIEGMITSVATPDDFELNGIRVLTTADTRFEHGTSSDIQLDRTVEVEGTVNSAGSIIADKIEFRFNGSRDITLEGHVTAVDSANATVTVFGLTVHVTAKTSLKDELMNLHLFSLSDIRPGDYLDIGGFVDSNGDIVAAKLERDTDPGAGNDELKGPVDMNSESGTTSFGILGITADVSGASSFKDTNDDVITKMTFFDSIDDSKDPGDIVKVKGSYAGGGIFTVSEAEIEKIN